MSNNSSAEYDCWQMWPAKDFEKGYGIAGACITVFGLLGNSLSIIVLSHATVSSTTSFLLKCLAAFDSALLITDAFVFALPWLATDEVIFRKILTASMLIMYPLASVSHTGTIYTMVVLSIERYMAISKPLQAKSRWTNSHARFAAIGILVWAFLYNIPRFIEYKPRIYFDKELNHSWLCAVPTGFGYDKYYMMIYLGYTNLFVKILLPLCLMSVLHVRLIRILRERRYSEFLPFRLSPCDEQRLTAIVISLTFVLFFCQIFVFIYQMLQSSMWADECSTTCFHFHHLTVICVMINSAINFIFYCVLGRSFRNILAHLFCFCDQPPQIVSL